MDKLLDYIVISIYEKETSDKNKVLDNALKAGRITLVKEDFTKAAQITDCAAFINAQVYDMRRNRHDSSSKRQRG